MNELSGKQKRQLRAMGQRLKPLVEVGRAGESDELLANLADRLARHELVKVRLPALPRDQRKELADDLARRTASHLVGTLGRTALLFRSSEDLPSEKRITLE
ncbi:MAG TPA: YhbY family RNA-binding protein [Phycisphaerae bacterium]|nr:YhbY family RNA-binding protein [Phycisphaerae bacterium]HQL71968.1 YhbY family RNA-binding protein [Phycisphaerae bacterium]